MSLESINGFTFTESKKNKISKAIFQIHSFEF